MDTTRDEALEAEISMAALRLSTATTSRDRRDAWNALCELQDERDTRRDAERGTGSPQ